MQGTQVVLEWDWMYKEQYQQLRSMYLQTETTFNWTSGANDTVFGVKIVSLEGEYFETLLRSSAYRRNIKLTLDIRSIVTYATTTTTSTTSTTTT